ncbi:hypothetical protein [Pseudomonas sp. NMS19W]|uniref:hypothetical protein n=1 Tax=Pseudomonas sp. NMS19W TaxID=3079768 RepID=UPI003F659DAC
MRESDHDCVQPRDDFIYTYPDIEDSSRRSRQRQQENRRANREGKKQRAGQPRRRKTGLMSRDPGKPFAKAGSGIVYSQLICIMLCYIRYTIQVFFPNATKGRTRSSASQAYHCATATPFLTPAGTYRPRHFSTAVGCNDE